MAALNSGKNFKQKGTNTTPPSRGAEWETLTLWQNLYACSQVRSELILPLVRHVQVISSFQMHILDLTNIIDAYVRAECQTNNIFCLNNRMFNLLYFERHCFVKTKRTLVLHSKNTLSKAVLALKYHGYI